VDETKLFLEGTLAQSKLTKYGPKWNINARKADVSLTLKVNVLPTLT
jgi:hypothetical protein